MTNDVLLDKETTAKRNDDAVKFQVHSPQNANRGYGTPVSIGATLMKMSENTAVLTRGMNTAQANPMTVCL